MRSRWDMHDSPPDILITNYSMLNIMLMRTIETSIFDKTSAWLAESDQHIFHLVVDELHTYRGTPGTEVAYLIRALLDRLGITPNSDQLRIISSSASLDGSGAGLQYLEQFFGRDRTQFQVIGGSTYVVAPSPHASTALAPHATAFGILDKVLPTAASQRCRNRQQGSWTTSVPHHHMLGRRPRKCSPRRLPASARLTHSGSHAWKSNGLRHGPLKNWLLASSLAHRPHKQMKRSTAF